MPPINYTKRMAKGRKARRTAYRSRYVKKKDFGKMRLSSHLFRTKTFTWYCRSSMALYNYANATKCSLPLYHSNTTAPIAPNTRGGYGMSMVFALDALPNYTDLTLLYDQYKIHQIKLRFEPAYNVSEMMLSEGLYGQQYIRIAHDYDDATIPSSEAELFEYGNMKSYDIRKPFVVTIYPWIVSLITNASASNVNGLNTKSKRLDMAQVIYHYGLKLWVPWIGSMTGDMRVLGNWTIEYVYSCYNTR